MNDLTYVLSDFPNNKFDIGRLSQDILDSDITIALASVTPDSDVKITFKAGLSVENKALLDAVIASHSGEPLDNEIVHFVEDIPQGGSRVTDKGFSFIATANSDTIFNYEVRFDWYVKDGSLWTYGAGEDDTISMSIAVPGGGPDLHYYLENIPLDKNGEAYAKNKAITETNLNGLDIRMCYKNTTNADVKVKVIVRAYQK